MFKCLSLCTQPTHFESVLTFIETPQYLVSMEVVGHVIDDHVVSIRMDSPLVVDLAYYFREGKVN